MKTNKQYSSCLIICFLSVSISLLLASGCSSTGNGITEAMLPRHTPEGHLWENLAEIGGEPSGYGMYTYVLFGRDIKDKNHDKRIWVLTELIRSSTSSADDFSPEDIDKSYFNLFLIPEWRLNRPISKSILTQLSVVAQDDKLRKSLLNPGPFLISVRMPISEINKNKKSEILYVDLSSTNEAAMEEVIIAYKARLTDSAIHGTEQLESIKLTLLNILLDADDYITIVKTAYANLLPDS